MACAVMLRSGMVYVLLKVRVLLFRMSAKRAGLPFVLSNNRYCDALPELLLYIALSILAIAFLSSRWISMTYAGVAYFFSW